VKTKEMRSYAGPGGDWRCEARGTPKNASRDLEKPECPNLWGGFGLI